MNNFNNNDEPQETVRQTLERVWREKEQQKQSSYAAKNHLARALPRETYIKSDRNYAWTTASRNNNLPKYLEQPETPGKCSVIGGALTGFAEGVMGGVERFFNGITDDYYGNMINDMFDNSYTKRQNMLQNRANSVGAGYSNVIANSAIDTSSNFLKYYYGGKLGNKIIK